jgi:acyl-CoA thioesterase FadM
MDRVKIKFPQQKPMFTATVPVRIVDINYGGHLGNDRILSVMHEARVQALGHFGYTEMNAGGNSLIMADTQIAYKGESFYGDVLLIDVFAGTVSDRSFDLLYHIYTVRNGLNVAIAHAKTGMVCFCYESRKITTMTTELNTFLTRDFNL